MKINKQSFLLVSLGIFGAIIGMYGILTQTILFWGIGLFTESMLIVYCRMTGDEE